MPGITIDLKQGIKLDKVYETAIETNEEQHQYLAENSSFELITLDKFIALVNSSPELVNKVGDPERAWNALFGHFKARGLVSYNPQGQFLTLSSLEQILENWPKFKHGIDFQHLPKGFHLAVNPRTDRCEVVHFSHRLQETQKNEPFPLSMTLTPLREDEVLVPQHFEGKKGELYLWLQSKINSFCNHKELSEAFKHFSKIIEQDMQLSYEMLDLDVLLQNQEEVNPILLLARWETLMTNPALKEEDRQYQWQALPHLSLLPSQGVIRAVTDYRCEEEACGFVIPEMKLTENDFTQEQGYRLFRDFKHLAGYVIDFEDKEKHFQKGKSEDDVRILQNKLFLHVRNGQLYFTVKNSPGMFEEVLIPTTMPFYSSILGKVERDCHRLRRGESQNPLSFEEEQAIYTFAYSYSPTYRPMNTHEEDFWRYIAYQPQRNSIQFYKKAIESIHRVKFKPAFELYRWSMYKALAASTTQKAHQAKGEEAEQEELKVWNEVCQSLGDFENNMPGWMRNIGKMTGQLIEGKAVADCILGTCSENVYSSLDFLYELLDHDLNAIYEISFEDLQNPTLKIKRLGDNKSKFLTLLDAHSSAYYQGARFYRHQGKWAPLTIEEYTSLQYDLHCLDLNLAQWVMPHLSTFEIQRSSEIDFLNQSLKKSNGHVLNSQAIDYMMHLWKDAIHNDNLSSQTLAQLFHELQTQACFANDDQLELAVIDLLEHHFSSHFEANYFIKKRDAIENRLYALTEIEKNQIRQYQFGLDEIALIESIDVALNKAKYASHQERESFTQIHERFSQLRYVLSEADFKLFLESLASFGSHFPDSNEPILQLMSLLISKKSISGFIQFAQFLKDSPPDSQLIHKFIFFIQEIKPRLSITHQGEKAVLDTLDFEEVMALILLKASPEEIQRGDYQQKLLDIIPVMNAIAKAHPITKTYLLIILKTFVSSASNIEEINQFVSALRNISLVLFSPSEIPSIASTDLDNVEDEARDNMLTFYDLLAHYHEQPRELVALVNRLLPFDSFPVCTEIQRYGSEEPLPPLRPRTVYLKTIANRAIDCRLTDEHGQLHPIHLIEDSDSRFSKMIFKELSDRAALTQEEEKQLLKLIGKESPEFLPQSSGFWSVFSKAKPAQLVIVSSVPDEESPPYPCIYISYDKNSQVLCYQLASSDEKWSEKKSIPYAEMRQQIQRIDLNSLINKLTPEKKLSQPLQEELLGYVHATVKKAIVPVQKRFILSLINRLRGNHKSLEGLNDLLLLLQNDTRIFTPLMQSLACPPYPDIPMIKTWVEENNFAARYDEYSLAPYGNRALEYSFQEAYYHTQKQRYEGIAPEVFTEERARDLARQLSQNRNKSIHQLREELSVLKAEAFENRAELKLQMLCLCIEMLARTTGQKHLEDPDRIISQELNTTQVMTLYAMLESGEKKVISQIATGEGKSRMAMILAAYQALMGKTVDIITSDFELSERDYLTYTPFFNSLNIKTSLISLNTPEALYQKNGINFSDDRQLFLLRNQSDILGRPFSYLEQEKEKRCLVLDEEDVLRHDKSADLYNYATPSEELRNYTWVYSYLVDFMQKQLLDAQKNHQTTLHVDDLIEPFKQYVLTWDSEERYRSLDHLRPGQIQTWLYSAYMAIRMVENQDYALSEAQQNKLFKVIDAHHKLRLTRKVLVVERGQAIEDSTFAAGLHQALCALNNKRVKDSFVIFPENAVQRSSLTSNFIDQYKEGQLYGMSGSTRSDAARSDIRINHESYKYIVTPPEKTLKREDKPTWLAKDEAQQIKFLKHVILEKLKKGNPVLLICKDDNQSARLYEHLIADPQVISALKEHQRIHALTSHIEAEQAISRAGNEACLTVSTVGRCARGKDIYATTDHPLLVLAAYIPTFEDEIQIKGRTARCGKLGEYRMIPHLQDPDCPIKGNTRDTEYEIQKLQNERAVQAVFQEEVSKLYAQCLEDVTQAFLSEYHVLKNKKGKEHQDELNLERLLDEWSMYLESMDKGWKKCKTMLLDTLSTKKKEAFVHIFQDFAHEFSQNIPTRHAEERPQAAVFNYQQKVEQVYVAAMQQFEFFHPKKQPLVPQSHYDPADDGKARIYTELFARTRAVLRGQRHFFADYYAWKEGRGELFPQWSGLLHGERPLFANTRASMSLIQPKEIVKIVFLALLTSVMDFIQMALGLVLFISTSVYRACVLTHKSEEPPLVMN